jgi:alpha-tubulin suppressor-like RCC1 family protein
MAGEVGNGSTPVSDQFHDPQRLIDDDQQKVSAVAIGTGKYHTCVVQTDRHVGCVGWNPAGQCGRYAGQTYECSFDAVRPVHIDPDSLLEGASQVAGGTHHSCAITDAGVYCWGHPRCGQLGNGVAVECVTLTEDDCDDEGYLPPVEIDLAGVPGCEIEQIGAGAAFTCARCADRRVACWGNGSRGRLGTGHETDNASPRQVENLTDAIDLAVGDVSACALREGGEVVCWGIGAVGQLGNGEDGDIEALSPVPVVGLP